MSFRLQRQRKRILERQLSDKVSTGWELGPVWVAKRICMLNPVNLLLLRVSHLAPPFVKV